MSLPARVTVSDGDQSVIAMVDAAGEVTRVCRDWSNSRRILPASTRTLGWASAAQRGAGRRTRGQRRINGRISEAFALMQEDWSTVPGILPPQDRPRRQEKRTGHPAWAPRQDQSRTAAINVSAKPGRIRR